MNNQGVFTVAKVAGDERLGQDDDGDLGESGERVQKVQIENSYFEKLNARLAAGRKPEPASTAKPEKFEGPGRVIYGDDGYPLKH